MKKRKKQRKSEKGIKGASTETHTAFNTQLFFVIVMFLIFASIAYCCFKSREIGFAIGFCIATLLPIFVFLTSPLYMVFSYKEIKIVYVMGQTEIIRSTDIRSITSFGGFSRYEPFPYYEIVYPKTNKYFFINGEIPKTLKTRRLIKKYYKYKLL